MHRLEIEFHTALALVVAGMTVAVAAALFFPLIEVVALAVLTTAMATCWFVGVGLRMGIRW